MILGSLFGLTTGLCVEDAGYVGSAALQSAAVVHDATMWAAVQAAMMLWQRHTNSKIADIRRDLADRRMVMAEAALGHARGAWLKEKAFVTETMGVGKFTPEYNRVNAVADMSERAWLKVDANFDERTAKLGLTVGQCDDARTARGMAIAKVDIMANAMRVAEARSLMLNDRRVSRQLAVLGLGRNNLQTAMQLGRLGEASANAVRNAVTTAFNIGMSVWGYEENRWRAGEQGQWRNRFNETARVTPFAAPVEDRSVRFVPDDLLQRTVFVERQPELDMLAESETPPI